MAATASAGWGRTYQYDKVVGKDYKELINNSIKIELPGGGTEEQAKTVRDLLNNWAKEQLTAMVAAQMPDVKLSDLSDNVHKLNALRDESRTGLSSALRPDAAVTMTAPGSARDCTRAATLGASPNTAPVASTTTWPDSRPIRAASCGEFLSAFLTLSSSSARWDGERRAHSTFGVVLLRLRIPEQGHQPVAEPTLHVAAKPRDSRRGFVQV